jgi:hypothetical protein
VSKKKILYVGEATFLATGFSNYANILLKELHKSGKYEIAELGTYVKPGDPRIASIPWKFYPGVPADNDAEGQREYNKVHSQWGKGQNLGQFGAWIIDRVVADFQPDYVLSLMDPWMSTVVADTPFRKYFKWIYMPCIDSTPQRQEWLQMYESADYLLGYSDFAINVLKEQSPKVKVAGVKKLLPMPARPPVDIEVFKPMDKAAVRAKWGIKGNLPIVLSCMRNQQRKLFCEMIDSFAKYKKDNPNDETAKKAVLLLHSSGYDAGQEYWLHIARLSQNKYLPYYFEDLYKHILHTYQCDSCHQRMIGYAIWLMNPRFERGRAYVPCPMCGNHTLRTPNTGDGFTRQELAEVFNLADLYVQVSIAGADEMPASEAKACGIPILISQNAAMAEKASIPYDFEGKLMLNKADGTPYSMHKGGIPIKIAYEFHEAATMQRRSYFNRADLAKKLKVLGDRKRLAELSKDAVFSIKDNCDPVEMSKKWMYVIDNLPPLDRNNTWHKTIDPTQLPPPSAAHIEIPNIGNEEFVDWCYRQILKTEVDGVGRKTWIEALAMGRPRKEIVEYFWQVAIKDKLCDVILYNMYMSKMQQKEMLNTLNNPNLLQGILIT